MATTVDLGLIREVVNDTLAAINALDGTIDDTTLGNKPNQARINRELLGLADQLNFVAALVKHECWTGKGLISYETLSFPLQSSDPGTYPRQSIRTQIKALLES